MIFSHVALSCNDLARTEEFYTNYFGFSRSRAIPLGEGNEIVFLKNSQSVYLELFRAEGARPAGTPDAVADGPHYTGVRHLAFQVADIEAAISTLGPAAEVTLGPLDFSDFIPGWKTIWIKDPDGNIVEISEGYTD